MYLLVSKSGCRVLRGTSSTALEARPASIAIMIATVLFLDYRYHRLPPLPKPLPCAKWRAKDGEIAPWLQFLSVSDQMFSRSSSRRVADAVIEAEYAVQTKIRRR
jgi:hypothetical protein